jgi:hypothetical protein
MRLILRSDTSIYILRIALKPLFKKKRVNMEGCVPPFPDEIYVQCNNVYIQDVWWILFKLSRGSFNDARRGFGGC